MLFKLFLVQVVKVPNEIESWVNVEWFKHLRSKLIYQLFCGQH